MMKLKHFLQIQAIALLSITLSMLLLSIGPRFIGFSSFVIYSGSMEPGIHKGSIAIGKPVQPADLRVGDVVAFKTRTGAAPTVHRIHEIKQEAGQVLVTTKGDANATVDPDVVVVTSGGARIVYSIPYVGYLVELPRTVLGPRVAFMLPAFALGAMLLWSIWSPVVFKKPQSAAGSS
jgi:signal peptidase